MIGLPWHSLAKYYCSKHMFFLKSASTELDVRPCFQIFINFIENQRSLCYFCMKSMGSSQKIAKIPKDKIQFAAKFISDYA